MYLCEICGRVVGPRTPLQRVVVETRSKKYPYRLRANPGYRYHYEDQKRRDGKKDTVRVRRRSKKLEDRVSDAGGEGNEIVREVTACPGCFQRS